MVRPPRLGKHQGVRVASTSLAGSQTPSERPIRGIGEPQRQIGEDGFGVSGAPARRRRCEIGPIEIGQRHSQQTSEIGLTNRPVQDCAEAGAGPQQGQQRERRQGGEAAAHCPGHPRFRGTRSGIRRRPQRPPTARLARPCLPAPDRI